LDRPGDLTRFKLAIRVDALPEQPAISVEDVSGDETAAELVAQLLRMLGLPADEQGWCLTYQGTALRPEAQLRLYLPATGQVLELVLRRQAGTGSSAPVKEESGSGAVALDEGDASLESSDFDIALNEDEVETVEAAEVAEEVIAEEQPGAVAGARPASVTPTKKASQAALRRATVRYYSRMNPERVYPLLVLLTEDVLKKVHKKDTDQRSTGPLQVDLDTPVEIEPVLPGCDCHPPKIIARLGTGDLKTTFRVVPRVLGQVEGASVAIRQDHAPLAEIALDVKVVRRMWVAVSGVMTLALPGVSTILKNFGIDFEPHQEQGFSLYLATARLVFDLVPPPVLTAGLGFATGFLWWLTRPQLRDVFWDIERVGPAERLHQIALDARSDPRQAAQALMELLKAFPDYQPARLYYAGWHFNGRNYQAALNGYERAFKLGKARALDYRRASWAASKLGRSEMALRILQEAERALPPGEMAGVMLFNMGCYHARLGDLDEAMDYLRRAVAAGFTKAQSYREDPDLAPLRSRPDFQRLLALTRES
jgi:hypothetical protein